LIKRNQLGFKDRLVNLTIFFPLAGRKQCVDSKTAMQQMILPEQQHKLTTIEAGLN